MGQNSKIEWTHHTMNPWRGCTKVSAGCAHCYAEKQAKRNPGVLGVWGDNGTRVIASESYWKQPLAWDRAAKAAGERHRVFCASMADVFEDRPELVEPRVRLRELISNTPNLDWLLLTKRPENIGLGWLGDRQENVWLGTSVENQAAADVRIPHLLACRDRAPVLFLSVEPLLGPVELSGMLSTQQSVYGFFHGGDPRDFSPCADECSEEELRRHKEDCAAWDRGQPVHRGPDGKWISNDIHITAPSYGMGISTWQERDIDLVIVGGESGPNARPMHPQWARSIRDQCQAAGVPFFFKQWGEWREVARAASSWGTMDASGYFWPDTTTWNSREEDSRDRSETTIYRVGKKAAGRILDGRTWDEMPEVTR